MWGLKVGEDGTMLEPLSTPKTEVSQCIQIKAPSGISIPQLSALLLKLFIIPGWIDLFLF